MTIASGTVNAGTSAGNSAALVTAVGAVIDAHPSWAFVERVTSGSNYADVYYNSTAGLYYALCSNGGSTLCVCLFEGYVSPNATKFIPQNGSGNPSTANSGDDSFQGSKNIAALNKAVSSASGNIWGITYNFGGTAIAWYVSISSERIILQMVLGVNIPLYAGLAEVPVGSRWRHGGCIGQLTTAASNNAAAVCRAAYGLQSLGVTFVVPADNWIPSVARDVNLDKYVYSKIPVINQAFHGYLRDVIYMVAPAGTALLDDVTLDGVNYTYFNGNVWVRTDA